MGSTEMRSHVLSPWHHLRRSLDSVLSSLFPSGSTARMSLDKPFATERVRGWTSLYELVTFRPDVGYHEALRRERWQKEVVSYGGSASIVLSVGAIVYVGLRRWR
jgi:kynurenine 3-monooxygenase